MANKTPLSCKLKAFDNVAERLRRWTVNSLCSVHVGSNPTLVVCVLFSILLTAKSGFVVVCFTPMRPRIGMLENETALELIEKRKKLALRVSQPWALLPCKLAMLAMSTRG